jgi:tetratricopeptide (TPR) repeat protein
LDGLDELVARQLLAEETAGYRFRHEIIQAVVYQQLGHWRRQMLHRRAGEALETLQPEDVAALAWHFERAEEPGRAARYALQAGEAAKQVFAHNVARAHFERALGLLEQEAGMLHKPEAIAANRRLQIRALYDRGWALRLLGDMETYAGDLQKVARLAELLGDGRALAHLRWREAYTHRWFCRYAQAKTVAEDGFRLSQEAAESLLAAQCLREIGMAAREMGNHRLAREVLEQALGLFVALGEVLYEIHAMGNLATLHWYLGDYQQALALSQQALARCDEAGLPLERRLPLGDLGAAAAAMGNLELARRCLEESLSIARQTTDRTQEILCHVHLGWLYIRLRQPAEALEHLQAGLALAEQIGSCAEQSWLHAGLAESHALHGDSDRATRHARRALALAEESGAAYDLKLARRLLNRAS